MADSAKILVVDDENSVLESFKMILGIKDYEVDVYEDSQKALADFKKGRYDVAFLDIKMAKMDGLTLLKKLKEIDPGIEIAMVTAYGDEQSHAKAIDLGALEYLRKPFLMEEIYELVDRGMRRRKTKKEIK